MALDISDNALRLLNQTNVRQQIILEIDGINFTFGALSVTEYWRIDDNHEIGEDGLIIGGVVSINEDEQRAYIDLGGTSKTITQQLLQEQGGSSSVGKVKVRLVDKNQEMSEVFSPNQVLDDVLAQNATVYLSFEGASFPEDAITIFNGIVDDITFGQGFVDVLISHSEGLKRQQIFPLIQTVIPLSIDASQTSMIVDDSTGFLLPTIGFKTYVRLDDEIIEYTGVTAATNTLTGLIRGSLLTIAASHDADVEVNSFYELSGDMIELTLQMLLSGGSEYYSENTDVVAMNDVSISESVPNAIFFDRINAETKFGLVEGDIISISGAVNAGNNGTHTITGFGTSSSGTYVIVSSTLIDEMDSTATCKFKSQYWTLPDGCGLNGRLVDVKQFVDLDILVGTNFPSYKFYLKDTVDAKDFIDSELLFVGGAYSIPRKGRISMGVTLPPLAQTETKTFNDSSVKRPDALTTKRNINKFFYNSIVYKYEEQPLEERYIRGKITTDEDSQTRISVGNRPLTIISKGLRKGGTTEAFVRTQSSRYLDRYKFAAEAITVETNFKTGLTVEVGDTVIFGQNLQLTDTTTGNRDYEPRLFEIINKSLNIVSGSVKFQCLDTAFELDGTYTTLSPSSYVESGATTTIIPLKKSQTTPDTKEENFRWQEYIGATITVRNSTFTFEERVTLIGFDSTNINSMIVSPALSIAPTENYVIDLNNFQNQSNTVRRLHAYFTPEIIITAGISSTSFKIALADQDKVFIGSIIRVHNSNFTVDASETKISNITIGADITIDVEDDLGFTPTSSEVLDLVGFNENGETFVPYRLL